MAEFDESPPAGLDCWAILELMGHRRLAGRLTEEQIAGAGFLRLDMPTDAGDVTQYYAPGSVYAITPTTEEVARRLAAALRPAPVAPFELAPLDVDEDDDDEVRVW